MSDSEEVLDAATLKRKQKAMDSRARRQKANPDLKPHGNEYKANPKAQAPRPHMQKKRVGKECKIEKGKIVKDEDVVPEENKGDFKEYMTMKKDIKGYLTNNCPDFKEYMTIKGKSDDFLEEGTFVNFLDMFFTKDHFAEYTADLWAKYDKAPEKYYVLTVEESETVEQPTKKPRKEDDC